GFRQGRHERTPAASADGARGATLPTCFLDTRDEATTGQAPEANPTDAEFAIVTAGTPAQATAISVLNRKLARRLRLDFLGLRRHAQLVKKIGKLRLDLQFRFWVRFTPLRPTGAGSFASSVNGGCRWLLSVGLGRLAERHAEVGQQLARLIIVAGGG